MAKDFAELKYWRVIFLYFIFGLLGFVIFILNKFMIKATISLLVPILSVSLISISIFPAILRAKTPFIICGIEYSTKKSLN